jgi:hypothetical protein
MHETAVVVSAKADSALLLRRFQSLAAGPASPAY